MSMPKVTRRMYEGLRCKRLARQRELQRLVRTLPDGADKRAAQIELARLTIPPALPRPLAWTIYDLDGDYMGTTRDLAQVRQYRKAGHKVETVTDMYPGGRELPEGYRKYMQN